MRGKKVKELRAAMMIAQFDETDLATRADRKMIKTDKGQRTLFRARKKNYLHTTQKPKSIEERNPMNYQERIDFWNRFYVARFFRTGKRNQIQ